MTRPHHTTSIDPEHGLTSHTSEPPPKYQPWPIDRLPEPLRSLVIEGAEALQCDPVLVVLPMLATIGAAIGNARHLTAKEGWHVPAMLWTLFIAESGSVKTPAMKLAKRPLEDIEHDACTLFDRLDAEHVEADEVYQDDLKRWKKKRDGERPTPPEPPHPTRYIVKDTTLAGLVEILQNNPRGLLVPTDELAGWFGSFNRHDQGGGDAQQWISIYSAEAVSVDRKGNRNSRGVMRPIKVYRPFVAITGAIQPGLWHSVLTTEHQASGMAARFLMAWPPRKSKRWSDATVSQSTGEAYALLIRQLIDLDHETTDSGHYCPKYIGMDSYAKRSYRDWYNRHNLDHVDRDGSLAAASAKIEEIPLRIGLILHCVKHATGDCQIDRVDAETMQAAITIADWHMAEAERIYDTMATESQSRPHRELADWIRAKGGSVTVRDVVAGKRSIRTAAEATERLTALESAGYGTWQDIPTTSKGGRPSRKFVLSGVSVSETPPKPEENDSCADADTADVQKVKTKRVEL